MLYGTTEAVAPTRRLRAGELRCELMQGALRDIRWRDVEVVRGISYLLRDRDWGTVAAAIGDVIVVESPTRFDVRFVLQMSTPAGTLTAAARVEGHADGRLVFEVAATPDADLETNRCGFVVLHPTSAAGRALRVEHTDGRTSEARFPLEISPSQPVLDIRGLSYAPAESLQLWLTLEAELPGDPAGKFEMEDQRNWSDASFKTYVASLLDPWPYELPADTTLTQRVSMQVKGAMADAIVTAALPRRVTIGAPVGTRMPETGIGVPAGFALASTHEKAALRDLGVRWWIVEIALDDPQHRADLAAIAEQRQTLDVQLRLDVIAPCTLSPDTCAALAADACDCVGLRVDAVRILPQPYLKSFQPADRWPDLPLLEAYAHAAREHFACARIGGGMFTCFTELNRKRQSAEGLDFIGHATFPIVHAADDRAVMQTIESLKYIVHSVQRQWPGLAYHLGPNAMAMRRNPYGDLPTPNPRYERLALAAADPRHDALFGAAWTAAYAAAVAPLGVQMLALHDSHGANGPLGRRSGHALAGDTATVPAWAMWRRFAAAAGSTLVALENLPDQISGIAWQQPGGAIEGVVINLCDEPRSLHWGTPVRGDGIAVSTIWKLTEFEAAHFSADGSATRSAP